MTTKSVFQPAHKRQRYLKVLLRGVSGTGKTRAALGFPGPVAVVDLEGSSDLYDGFDVFHTKDLRELDHAVAELSRGTVYQTVVIDSLTVVWQLLQQAGQSIVDARQKRKGEDSLTTGQALTDREWGIIKRWYAAFLTRLINLPVHVVLIARETDLYDKEAATGQLRKIGTKADVEKNTEYNVSLVLLLQTERTEKGARYFASVEKTRLDALPLGTVLTGYGKDPAAGLYAKHLAPVAAALSTNAPPVQLADEATAAPQNAAALDTLADDDRATEQQQVAIRALLPRAGMTEAELLGKMGVAALAEFTRTKAARVVDRLTANARERKAPLISAADLARCNGAAVDLGWGDTDVVQYLQRYGVRTFVELSPEHAAEVVPDLESKAAQVQGEAI